MGQRLTDMCFPPRIREMFFVPLSTDCWQPLIGIGILMSRVRHISGNSSAAGLGAAPMKTSRATMVISSVLEERTALVLAVLFLASGGILFWHQWRAHRETVIDAVLEECPAVLGQLEQALSSCDAPLVRRFAHTIKGALRTFVAARATELAEQIEEKGWNGALNGAPELLAELNAEVTAVLTELAGFSSKPGADETRETVRSLNHDQPV